VGGFSSVRSPADISDAFQAAKRHNHGCAALIDNDLDTAVLAVIGCFRIEIN
jgi:hypothetical protein